ncbi:hypothetical protein T492DRAFT_480367 [Pavlovales sp. CCMP2436]|nr:hypothetical protein T492DRAFT_480367 [Pavlovales sp. CCMP2436]
MGGRQRLVNVIIIIILINNNMNNNNTHNDDIYKLFKNIAVRALGAGEAGSPSLPPATCAALALLARADASCGLAAYVLKPALLGGLGACAALRARAQRAGAVLVLSAAFESGVALAHLALLAEALAPAASESSGGGSCEPSFHGLNTFDALAADLLSPPFAVLVDGAHVPLGACEQALRDYAESAAAADA